jgi:hypothetical protein
MDSIMRTQREIHEEEQRLKTAMRRLARHDLLAPSKARERSSR